MNNSTKGLCCLLLVLSLTASCGKREPEVRTETFMSVEQPVKVGNVLHCGIVRNAKGDLVIAAFLDTRFKSATGTEDVIALLESRDSGATWSEISRLSSFVTYGVWGYDLDVGEGDTLYLTWVSAVYKADSPSPFKALMFSRSDDGGRSWTAPKWINDLEEDQRSLPDMVVSGNNVYVTWLDSRLESSGYGHITDQTVFFASSSDRGETWSANECLEIAVDRKAAFSGTPAICLGDDGAIYCAYFSMRSLESKRGMVGGWWIARSTDGGKTFVTDLAGAMPAGAIAIAAADDKVYLACEGLPDRDIRLFVSDDGGEDWDEIGIIDDDPDNRERADLKLVALGGGRLIACWHDGRGGVYGAASLDGGETWGKNIWLARQTTVGNTPIDIAVDGATGEFALTATDVRHGGGDATYLTRGKLVPAAE
ncbi:MAG: sialidase family protein [Planctomycetota bacterium]